MNVSKRKIKIIHLCWCHNNINGDVVWTKQLRRQSVEHLKFLNNKLKIMLKPMWRNGAVRHCTTYSSEKFEGIDNFHFLAQVTR